MNVNSPRSAACYDDLASVYDLTGQSRFSLRMVSYLLELLALRHYKPRRVLDLACGTGAGGGGRRPPPPAPPPRRRRRRHPPPARRCPAATS